MKNSELNTNSFVVSSEESLSYIKSSNLITEPNLQNSKTINLSNIEESNENYPIKTCHTTKAVKSTPSFGTQEFIVVIYI